MNITETRKKIIELLEPYMDKTSSDGCLIKINKYRSIYSDMLNKSIEGYQKIISLNGGLSLNFSKHHIGFINNFGDISIVKNKFKIIGHYDWSVVGKYIFKKSGYGFNMDDEVQIISTGIDYDDENETIFQCKYKPIYLLSEEEDQKLLKILLKLK